MMGGWLARLKNENAPDTYATEATKTPQGEGKGVFVGFVAYPPVPFEKIEGGEPVAATNDGAASDLAPTIAPDRWCWPHSVGWNTKEIDTFSARLARFTDKGASYDDAERLADALVIRDREGDDRRMCLECIHLNGEGRWRCGNWQPADVARDGLASDLVLMLQWCGGFAAQQELIER